MEITFYHRPVVSQGQEWTRTEGWPTAETVPRKGELVKVTVTANDGALVQREMRVIEVCHTGPRNVQVYLVPTYVKVASLQT
jgi:hypothetical protein